MASVLLHWEICHFVTCACDVVKPHSEECCSMMTLSVICTYIWLQLLDIPVLNSCFSSQGTLECMLYEYKYVMHIYLFYSVSYASVFLFPMGTVYIQYILYRNVYSKMCGQVWTESVASELWMATKRSRLHTQVTKISF